MNWTTVFPVFRDEFVESYERDAEVNNHDEIDRWFSIEQTFNPTSAEHLVVFSLFWKPAQSGRASLPALTRDILLQAEELELVDRFPPWEHYVLPLLEGTRRLRAARPDVGVRIYLAADMHFLVDDFLALGCEICLMKSSSLQHNPGAMWRFLALEERGRLITISDADRAPMVEQDVQRTEAMNDAGLGFWRVPVWGELNTDGLMAYRPILACQFGTSRSFEVSTLMKAFVWHSKQGTLSTKCHPPGGGERDIYGTKWPDYGFDEWFLLAAIFPRAAASGILTFVPSIARSQLLPLDIEYCTWS